MGVGVGRGLTLRLTEPMKPALTEMGRWRLFRASSFSCRSRSTTSPAAPQQAHPGAALPLEPLGASLVRSGGLMLSKAEALAYATRAHIPGTISMELQVADTINSW